MTELSTDVGGLALGLPGMVASGIMDETGASMVRMLEAGAGAVVTKSIGLQPNAGDGRGRPAREDHRLDLRRQPR